MSESNFIRLSITDFSGSNFLNFRNVLFELIFLKPYQKAFWILKVDLFVLSFSKYGFALSENGIKSSFQMPKETFLESKDCRKTVEFCVDITIAELAIESSRFL